MSTAPQLRPQSARPQPYLLPTATAHPHRLAPTTSSLLDLIRLTAALLVVAAHLGHPEFHTALPNLQILGDIAVPVFFVLSGFVIRYITLARPHTLRQFLIDRAARIYSIALPAMAVTLVIAALTARIAPLYFQQDFAATCDHPIARLALNLTFLSQSWSHNTIPFINSPFWSLSYEVLYYLAYGLAFYLRGLTRVLALALWAILAGPQVLFLLPIWLLGVALYDLHRSPTSPKAITQAAIILATCVLLLATNPLEHLHIPAMRATPFATATGTLAAIALLALLTLADRVRIPRESPIHPWLTRFRRIADGTFAIYLMHYPLMVLATATGLLRPNALALNLSTTAAICLVLIAIAVPLDRLKLLIRSTLLALIPPTAKQKGTSTQPIPFSEIQPAP